MYLIDSHLPPSHFSCPSQRHSESKAVILRHAGHLALYILSNLKPELPAGNTEQRL